MNTKYPPVILATENNTVKNRLLEKLVHLDQAATCIAPSELELNPEQFFSELPAILVIDVTKAMAGLLPEKILSIRRQSLLKVIVLGDPKTINKFSFFDDTRPLTMISSDPSISELAHAINFCRAKLDLQVLEQEQKKEHWTQRALQGLYERTSEKEAQMAGIMGITATALNALSAVLTIGSLQTIKSIVSHSGAKPDRLELLWKRLPDLEFDTGPLSQFLQIKTVGQSKTSGFKSAHVFSPTTALITRISRPGHKTQIMCVLAEPTHSFRDFEKRIFMQAALMTSILTESNQKTERSLMTTIETSLLNHPAEIL
jgi:hypothetical protein